LEKLQDLWECWESEEEHLFPIATWMRAGQPHGDIRYEDAKLLDPIDEDDPGLLSFNMEGRAIPAAHLTDAWEKERVKYSVERYNLDFPPLMDKRKAVWDECWHCIREFKEELATYHNDERNVIARDRSKQALKRLRELMREDRELSSVARACVLSSGDPRVTGILQSA
jgi:hypothetical protein